MQDIEIPQWGLSYRRNWAGNSWQHFWIKWTWKTFDIILVKFLCNVFFWHLDSPKKLLFDSIIVLVLLWTAQEMRSEDFVATPKRLLNLGKRDARYTYTCMVPYYHYLLILDYTYPMLLLWVVLCTYLPNRFFTVLNRMWN